MPDINYARPLRTRQYISRHKHQRNAGADYSKWNNVNLEKQVFDNSDFGEINAILANATALRSTTEWIDNIGNLWGISVTNNRVDYVGTSNEQFGYFPKPSNEADHWHGYPVTPFSNIRSRNGEPISACLLQKWIDDPRIPIDSDDLITLIRRKSI